MKRTFAIAFSSFAVASCGGHETTDRSGTDAQFKCPDGVASAYEVKGGTDTRAVCRATYQSDGTTDDSTVLSTQDFPHLASDTVKVTRPGGKADVIMISIHHLRS